MLRWHNEPPLHPYSPVYRYARRALRSRKTSLQTRSLSISSPKLARQNHDDGAERPAGLSNLEWMQLQHHRRWQRKIIENPFRALFGASSDMLAGKGLRDWQWFQDRFPRWMLNDMEANSCLDENQMRPSEKPSGKEGRGGAPSHPETKHSRATSRADVTGAPQEHPSHRPASRAHHFERSDSASGFSSPSDTRRPREGTTPTELNALFTEPVNISMWGETYGERSSASLASPISLDEDWGRGIRNEDQEKNPHASKDDHAESRVSQNIDQDIRRRGESPAITPTDQQPASRQGIELADILAGGPVVPAQSRSPAEVLAKLPKDDVDPLNADEIRARMGKFKDKVHSSQARDLSWNNLGPNVTVKSMEQSKIDTGIRLEEPTLPEKTPKEQESLPTNFLLETKAKTIAADASTADVSSGPNDNYTSITKWLKEGSVTFSKIFWSDPGHIAASDKYGRHARKLESLLHDIVKGNIKCRRVMDQIEEDLRADVPSTRPLLNRLKRDERNLTATIRTVLHRDFGSVEKGDRSPSSQRSSKYVQTLRAALAETDAEISEACRAVTAMKVEQPISKRFTLRMETASRAIKLASKSTRLTLFRLQSQLESTNVPLDCNIGHRLLALQDTQLGLLRVVELSMQTLGIAHLPYESPASPAEVSEAHMISDAETLQSTPDNLNSTSEPGGKRRDPHLEAAAFAKLNQEVEHQKSVMDRLADDVRASPRNRTKMAFDKPILLTHSLFRPFGEQVEALGKDKESTKIADTESSLDPTSETPSDDLADIGHIQESGPKAQQSEVLNESYKSVTSVQHDYATQTEAHSAIVEGALKANKRDGTEVEPESFDQSPFLSQPDLSPNKLPPSPSKDPDTGLSSQDTQPATRLPSPFSHSSSLPLTPQTTYQILTYDSNTDLLSTSTSTSSTPSTDPTLPLHEALAALTSPSKFVPHIPDNHEVITAKGDMLVLRANCVPDPTKSQPASSTLQYKKHDWKTINPVDGTTRLSPTGYVGVDDLGRDFAERRRLADEHIQSVKSSETDDLALGKGNTRSEGSAKKRRGGVASVLRTAIVAGAVCYVFGVVSEVLR